MAILPAAEVARLRRALPFWLSLVMIPLLLLGASLGGWTLALLPLYGWEGLPCQDSPWFGAG